MIAPRYIGTIGEYAPGLRPWSVYTVRGTILRVWAPDAQAARDRAEFYRAAVVTGVARGAAA